MALVQTMLATRDVGEPKEYYIVGLLWVVIYLLFAICLQKMFSSNKSTYHTQTIKSKKLSRA
jgi:hypothetical protein